MSRDVLHELKVPVSSIRGYAQILMGSTLGTLNAEQDNILQRIILLCDELTALMERHLRLELAGSKEVRDFSLARVTAQVEKVFRTVANEKRIIFQTKVDSSLPRLQGSANDLERILINLLDNAAKFAGARERVTLAVTRNGGNLKVSVKDTGPGIARRDLKRVLQGVRVDNPVNRSLRPSGRGLGLRIVQRLLKQWRASLEVESELGGGSTFTFRIPKRYLTKKGG